jgi:hypothetical protein
MVDEKIKRTFSLSREDIYFIVIIVMVGVNMWFTYTLVDPILQLQQNQYRFTYIGIAQNERILDVLTNGTDDSTADIINKVKNMDITEFRENNPFISNK